uniref:SXP/RAL-2 family protein Ani s 5-like cation-binding domain-containing protein n=1 Tax=Meloidogyne enterolobii TaxID=390850 RepID=A0A6V7Y5Y4_MELEN|nr:unnamed protein product [Meloidogyne enterolobii]
MRGRHLPQKILKIVLLFTLVTVTQSRVEGNWSDYQNVGENVQNLKKHEEIPLGKKYDNGENIENEMAKNENDVSGKANEKVKSSNLIDKKGFEDEEGESIKKMKNRNEGKQGELINNFPFLRDVPYEEVKKFQQISNDPNLTKGELEVERQQWAEKQNTDVMNAFYEWKAKIEESKKQEKRKLEDRLNLFTEGMKNILSKIEEIIDDKGISRKQECEKIRSLLIENELRKDFTEKVPMQLVDFCMKGADKNEEVKQEQNVDQPIRKSTTKDGVWPYSKNDKDMKDATNDNEEQKEELKPNPLKAGSRKPNDSSSSSSSSENVEKQVNNAINEEEKEIIKKENEKKTEDNKLNDDDSASSSGSASSVEEPEKDKKGKVDRMDKKSKNKGGGEKKEDESSSSSSSEGDEEDKKKRNDKAKKVKKRKVKDSSSSSSENIEEAEGKKHKKRKNVKKKHSKKEVENNEKKVEDKSSSSSSSSGEDDEKMIKKAKKNKRGRDKDADDKDEDEKMFKKKHKHHKKGKDDASSSSDSDEKTKKHKKHKTD